MYFLSFDIATKSLATSFIYFDINNLKINNIKIKECKDLINLNHNIKSIFEYYICEVTDLIPNKKLKNTNVIERSKALNIYINNLNEKINNIINKNKITKIILLIENQPTYNDKSKTIQNQIIYAFSNNPIYKIKNMNPIYKNKIYFNKKLQYSNFIGKYSNNYLANKNHTKYNFLYFLISFNMFDKIKIIKKKNYDDIADSFLQIFAYIYI